VSFTALYLLNYPGVTLLVAYIVEGSTQRNLQWLFEIRLRMEEYGG